MGRRRPGVIVHRAGGGALLTERARAHGRIDTDDSLLRRHRTAAVTAMAETRSCLPAILDQAGAGLEVELTRRGQPVAVVVSRRELDRLRGQRRHFGDTCKSFLQKCSLDDIGLDNDVTFVRDQTPGRKVRL